MTRLAAADVDVAPRLQEPDVIWAKAQLIRRWDAERKVQSPLDTMEPIQLLAGLAGAATLLSWSLPSLLRLLPSLTI